MPIKIMFILIFLLGHLTAIAGNKSAKASSSYNPFKLLKKNAISGSLNHKDLESQDLPQFNEPTRIHFDRMSSECQNWLKAQRKFCGENDYLVAQALLESFELIDFQTFRQALVQKFNEFKQAIGTKPFILLIDQEKSSEWIASLLREELSELNYTILYQDEMKTIEQYLTQHPWVVDLVRIDDATYTGSQILYFIDILNSNIEKIGENKSALSGSRPSFNLHMITPYSTQFAQDILRLRASAKSTRIHFQLYSDLNLKSLSEQEVASDENFLTILHQKSPWTTGPLTQATELANTSTEDFRILFQMNLSANHPLNASPKELDEEQLRILAQRKATTVFFQHKLPDSVSTFSELVEYGAVVCSSDSIGIIQLKDLDVGDATVLEPELPLQFDCVPWTYPPYKKRALRYPHVRVSAACSQPNFNWGLSQEVCEDYHLRKKAFIEKLNEIN